MVKITIKFTSNNNYQDIKKIAAHLLRSKCRMCAASCVNIRHKTHIHYMKYNLKVNRLKL